MKTKLLIAIVLMIVISGTGHGLGLQKRVRMQQEFDLRAGRQATIKDAGLSITFVELIEDSRCPEGVDCIWAGNGEITLFLKKGRHKSVIFKLNTTSEPKSFTYQGYEISLVKLAPYPKIDVKINKGDYVATLVVKRKVGT